MNAVTPISKSRSPSFIEKVEDAIVEALKSGVDGSVKVESFPADTESYDFAGLKAALLVHYTASQYQPRSGPANPSQMRRMNFAIVLLTRSLRGDGGAYGTLEDVRRALQGESFEGAGPAEIVRDGLVREDKGQWRFEIVIGLNAPAVAQDRQRQTSLMRPVIDEAIPGRGNNI